MQTSVQCDAAPHHSRIWHSSPAARIAAFMPGSALRRKGRVWSSAGGVKTQRHRIPLKTGGSRANQQVESELRSKSPGGRRRLVPDSAGSAPRPSVTSRRGHPPQRLSARRGVTAAALTKLVLMILSLAGRTAPLWPCSPLWRCSWQASRILWRCKTGIASVLYTCAGQSA